MLHPFTTVLCTGHLGREANTPVLSGPILAGERPRWYPTLAMGMEPAAAALTSRMMRRVRHGH